MSATAPREKKRRRNHFHLNECTHEAEYQNIKRPVDPRTNEPIEPAHRYEVTLEPDDFTDEKSATLTPLSKRARS